MAIGQKIIHLLSVDSTNNYAANLLKEGKLEHGTVILADEQFAGRGQRGAEWTSTPGDNLTFSFYLDDVNLAVQEQFRLTQIISLGIIEFLKKFNVQGKIKWPNDIYVDDQKICGVLIENQLCGMIVKSAIVGIGLNVNQTNFGNLNATSLALLLSKQFVLFDTVLSFFHAMNFVFEKFNFHSDKLQTEYLAHLYRYGIWADYKVNNQKIKGNIKDVSPEGKLILQEENGNEQSYFLKEIQFIV